ncbi:cytochrome P450 [Nostoc sp. CHAB 5715]|uniref:cytochrome P450 n=1 Tax=Nostoc sp. CHAB 5715 TaxID=2780400 RepID=UPI001E3939FB|nr:cytochrome P450 [Nostoc sp. CHAB 5715]MCC5624401.1 cytochrome P450 [Nostoc sp. CHAB 5715]
MPKRNLKSALTTSLKEEDKAVQTRFEKAESLLADKPRSIDAPQAEPPKEEIADVPPLEKKVIRDTFTMPSEDYELIAVIQERCLQSAMNVTRSEIVRAGLRMLHDLNDEKLTQALKAVEKIKSGRPPRKKQ